MGAPRTGRPDAPGSGVGLEEQESCTEPTGEDTQKSKIYRYTEGTGAMFGTHSGSRAAGGPDSSGEGQSQGMEPNFCRAEEGSQAPPHRRLPGAQHLYQVGSFSDGGPKDSQGDPRKERLRYHHRLDVSLLSNPFKQKGSTVPCHLPGEQGLHVSRTSLRLQSGTKTLHYDYEKGGQKHSREVEGPNSVVPRRYHYPGPGENGFDGERDRDQQFHRVPGVDNQQGEEPALPLEGLRLPGVAVECIHPRGQNSPGEGSGAPEEMPPVGQESHDMRDGSDEGTRITDRLDECIAFCVHGRFSPPPPPVQTPGQVRKEEGLEEQHETTPWSSGRTPPVDGEDQGKQVGQIGEAGGTPSDNDDRRFGLGNGGSPEGEKQDLSLHAEVAGILQGELVQLPRVSNRAPVPPKVQDHPNGREDLTSQAEVGQRSCCVQSEEEESRSESSPSTPSDSSCDGRDESPYTTGTCRRNSQPHSGCPVQAGMGRRLRYLHRGTSRGLPPDRLPANPGCLRLNMECEMQTMVRPGLECGRGRSQPSLDGGEGAGTPSHTSHIADPEEGRRGESPNSPPPACVEESSLVQESQRACKSEDNLAKCKGNSSRGPADEDDGCEPPTRAIHGRSDLTQQEKGEKWFVNSMSLYGWSDKDVNALTASVTQSTWKGYCSVLAKFGDEYRRLFPQMERVNFEEFAQRCTKVAQDLQSKGKIGYNMTTKLRSVLSLFTEIAFGKKIGDYAPFVRLVKALQRTKRPRRLNYSIWQPSLVFDYYMGKQDNEWLSFHDLTIKAILLIVLTTACRFAELASISMEQSEWIPEGINLSVKLKTKKERDSIFVSRITGEKEKLCPVRCIKALWEIASTRYHKRSTFLLNTKTYTPLTTSGIRRLARLGMDMIGIPKRFTPYSLKHAAISDLLRKGAPEAVVARHARLSELAHTPIRHYFRAEFEESLNALLLSSSNDEDSDPPSGKQPKKME